MVLSQLDSEVFVLENNLQPAKNAQVFTLTTLYIQGLIDVNGE
jgi:hypothetical protein